MKGNGEKLKMKYFAAAYAHVCRTEKARSKKEAAQMAFGLVDAQRMTVMEYPSNPKYLPAYKKTAFIEQLAKRHHEKTGSILSGWEKLFAEKVAE